MAAVWRALRNPCVSGARIYAAERASVYHIEFVLVCLVARHVLGKRRVLHAAISSEFAFWEEEGFLAHCTVREKTTLPPCMNFFVPCSCPKPTPYVFRMKTDLVHNISAFRKHAIPFVQVTMRTGTGGRGGGARLRTKGERPGQGGKVVRGFG